MTPRFGEVWEFESGARWMFVAIDLSRAPIMAWWALYLGTRNQSGIPLMQNRMAVGRRVLDSMGTGVPGWSRLE